LDVSKIKYIVADSWTTLAWGLRDGSCQ